MTKLSFVGINQLNILYLKTSFSLSIIVILMFFYGAKKKQV